MNQPTETTSRREYLYHSRWKSREYNISRYLLSNRLWIHGVADPADTIPAGGTSS